MERKILLASHGELAKGMVDSAKMIIGVFDYPVETFCLLPGHHPDEFKNSIENEIVNNEDTEYIIVTDLYGASVTTSLYQLTKYKNVKMFCGMNLNLVLSILVEYKNKLSKEDIKQIVNDSQCGVKCLTNNISFDENEF